VKLIVQGGPTFELEGAEEWIVGRDPDEATFVLEDPRVSRRHLKLQQTPEGIVAENLSASAAVRVNGEPISAPRLLREGDRLELGDTHLTFGEPESEEAPPEPQGETEEAPYDTLFGDVGPVQGAEVHLTPAGRWLLKVIAGPNAGAELGLEADHSYLLGTDRGSCDVVFHDLSVSRQHARVTVGRDGRLQVEDLHSRNGVVVEGKQVEGSSPLGANQVVTLGTTSFVVLDTEAAQETIVAAVPEEEPEPFPEPAATAPKEKRSVLAGGTFLLLLIGLAVIAAAVLGTSALFKTEAVDKVPKDYAREIEQQLNEWPDIRFTFTTSSGKLFLLGHVLTPLDKTELMYNLDNLGYIQSSDDNVVVDQYIWEETNAILGKHPDWQGVSMHSPVPGMFVLTGYLDNREQATKLEDYLALNFPYVDRLDNQVVVEEVLLDEVQATLLKGGFSSVTPTLSDGDLILKGGVDENDAAHWRQTVQDFKKMRGIRNVRDFVVMLSHKQAMVDLSDKYKIQGWSTKNGKPIGVMIGGQILTVGDTFQGMRITDIGDAAIHLEKDGVKFKISYNP